MNLAGSSLARVRQRLLVMNMSLSCLVNRLRLERVGRKVGIAWRYAVTLFPIVIDF